MSLRIDVLMWFLFFGFILMAQSPSEADALFNERAYEASAAIYAQLLEKQPNSQLYNYRYARCCYEMQQFEDAIYYFLKGGNRYPLRDYYLAASYFYSYRFDQAIEYLNAYMHSKSVNEAFLPDVQDKLSRGRMASRLMNRVEDVEILDSLLVSKQNFLQHFDLSKETGRFEQETITTASDKTIDLITFITQRGDRKIFSKKDPASINLYKSNKLLYGWSKAESLSENINSDADENYPFLMLDGLTLYFASNGENSMGGYDIFITRFNAHMDDYLNPENIGFPFNSLANDYMLVVDEINRVGWFVTDRNQNEGMVVIYSFRYRDEKSYVPTDDPEYLLQAAQLKVSRNSKSTEQVRIQPAIPVVDTDEEQTMLFVLNDTLTYTHTGQFKSAKALKTWNEWHRISMELTGNENTLSELRQRYEATDDVSEKKKMSQEIMQMESELLTLRLLLKEKSKNIRNEEIKYLKNIQGK